MGASPCNLDDVPTKLWFALGSIHISGPIKVMFRLHRCWMFLAVDGYFSTGICCHVDRDSCTAS